MPPFTHFLGISVFQYKIEFAIFDHHLQVSETGRALNTVPKISDLARLLLVKHKLSAPDVVVCFEFKTWFGTPNGSI